MITERSKFVSTLWIFFVDSSFWIILPRACREKLGSHFEGAPEKRDSMQGNQMWPWCICYQERSTEFNTGSSIWWSMEKNILDQIRLFSITITNGACIGKLRLHIDRSYVIKQQSIIDNVKRLHNTTTDLCPSVISSKHRAFLGISEIIYYLTFWGTLPRHFFKVTRDQLRS